MRFSILFGLSLVSVAFASPLPEPGLADTVVGAPEHVARSEKREFSEKIARAFNHVGLAETFKHIMTSDEPVDLVTRQAANTTSAAAAKGKKAKKAKKAAKGKKGKKAKKAKKAAGAGATTAPAAQAATAPKAAANGTANAAPAAGKAAK